MDVVTVRVVAPKVTVSGRVYTKDSFGTKGGEGRLLRSRMLSDSETPIQFSVKKDPCLRSSIFSFHVTNFSTRKICSRSKNCKTSLSSHGSEVGVEETSFVFRYVDRFGGKRERKSLHLLLRGTGDVPPILTSRTDDRPPVTDPVSMGG